MFNIGTLSIKNNILAAPMAGVSDKAFRIIAGRFGAGLTFTEMVSSMGLTYQQKKTFTLIDTGDEHATVGVQLFGCQPEAMARAAKIAQAAGAPLIDINMGCPVNKVVKSGAGAALMKDVKLAKELARAVVQAVDLPVTAKIRLGWNEEHINCIELAGELEAQGVKAVTVHGRTKEQLYSGMADWKMIKAVKQHLSIPVIGNGDIWKAEDALRMLEMTGCDAVMVGRGALGNPFIFRDISALIDGKQPVAAATTAERIQTAREHLDLAVQLKGPETATQEMRKHLAWYMKGLPGAARLRQQINQARTPDVMRDILLGQL